MVGRTEVLSIRCEAGDMESMHIASLRMSESQLIRES